MSRISPLDRSNPSRDRARLLSPGQTRREIVACLTLVVFGLSQAVLPVTLALRSAQAQSAAQSATQSSRAAVGRQAAAPTVTEPAWYRASRAQDAQRRQAMAQGMKTLLAQGPNPPGRGGGNRAGGLGAGVEVTEIGGLDGNAKPGRASVPGQIAPSAALYVPNPYTTVVPLDLSNERVPSQKEVSGQGAMCGALAPAAPADPAEFEAEIDQTLQREGFRKGLKTALPSSEQAGLTPGVRVAAKRLESAKKRVKDAKEANRDFALSMKEWNAGRFKKAVGEMEAYSKKHPRSPWLPEALIHIADYAKFTAQPTRAQELYQQVMEMTSATSDEMSYEAHQKAYERWADLYLVEGRWAEARPMLEDLVRNDLHWRRRTWADYWLRQLAVKSSDRNQLLALRNCGPLALAMVLDELGRNEAARRVAALRPSEADGVSLAQMRQIAAREGVQVEGFRARASQLAALPLPLILHYTPLPTPKAPASARAKTTGGKSTGAKTTGGTTGAPQKASDKAASRAPGHFMIVRALDARRGTVDLVNPQDGARSTLSLGQLEREWSGAGLMLAARQKARTAPGDAPQTVRWLASASAPAPAPAPRALAASPGAKATGDKVAAPRVARLSEGEMNAVRGTCYVVLPQNGLGENPANDGCTTGNCPPNRGTPGVAVNQLSQNVFINDTPVWYDAAFGPAIDVTLSYNSHDASNYNSVAGNKWSLNFGSHLVEAPAEQEGWMRVTLFAADGKQLIFEFRDREGGVANYTSPRGVYDTLVRTNISTYVLTSPEGDKSFYGVPPGVVGSTVPMLLEQRDRWGHSLRIQYFQPRVSDVRIQSVTAADGKVMRFSYDNNGRLVQVSDPFERQANFRYDDWGNLVECIDMAGYAFQYTYDDLVNVRQMNTPQGVWNFAYTRRDPQSGAGRDSVTVFDPLSQKKKFEWEGHYAITTDTRGAATALRHQILIDTSAADAQAGLNKSESAIRSETAPTGETTTYTYANQGDGTANARTLAPIAVTDARGATTSFAYNWQGNVTRVTDPKGQVTQLNYTSDGLDVNGVVNANGVNVAQARYNAWHQPIWITTEDGATTFGYTAWGAPQSVSDALSQTTYTYNAARRLQNVVRDGVTVGTFTYDAVGRLKSARDTTGLTLGYDYDSLNRLTRVFYPDGTSEETDYAMGGLPGMTQDRAGRRSYYDYDALKRLVRMQDALGQTLQMDYDAAGNLLHLLDAQGHSTRWAYDASGRVTGKQYHDGATEGYGYSQGLLAQTTNARGLTTRYGYDRNANLTLVDYPHMADVSLTYNALDDVDQITDGVGTHGFGYSPTGRLISLSGPFVDDAQRFLYDNQGRLSDHYLGRGASVDAQHLSYAYDALERLKSITSSGGGGVGTFTYNYVGDTAMLARLELPNGTQTVQSYDGLNRLTQTVNQKNNGTNLNKFAYTYDTRDVRTGVQSQHGSDPLRQVNYTYDATDQLKTESTSGGVAGTNYSNVFNYDSMGNRTWAENVKGGDTTVTQLTPNALNQISALSQSRNGATPVNSGFVYDAAGNTKQIENANGGKTLFDYDDADRLVRIETRNGADVPVTRSEFVYDYASRKAVSKEFTWTAGAWVKTGETRRVFDGLDVVQERNAANEVTAQLVRDGNIGGILSRSTAAGASFFGYDGGGNVTLLTDENGNDVGRYRYDAFGNTLEASGSRAAENPYRFSTKELHAASGLYDFGYRFYSAGLGRWINRDPLEEDGGVNLYAIVGNSPVNAIDSYGLKASMIIDEENKTIRIFLRIYYQGNGSNNKAVRDSFNSAIESAWSGRIGGYRVSTSVLGPNGVVDISDYNIIQLKAGRSSYGKGKDRSHVCPGNESGMWLTGDSPATAAHEAGHLMGLPDRYMDNVVNGRFKGSIAKDPEDKNWDKNIMGKLGQLPDGEDLKSIMKARGNTISYGHNAAFWFSGM